MAVVSAIILFIVRFCVNLAEHKFPLVLLLFLCSGYHKLLEEKRLLSAL